MLDIQLDARPLTYVDAPTNYCSSVITYATLKSRRSDRLLRYTMASD